jgi:hypothetical protein
MGNTTINYGAVKIIVSGVSNVTQVIVKTPTYDERGEVDGYDEQTLSFETFGEELKDFIKAVEILNDEL